MTWIETAAGTRLRCEARSAISGDGVAVASTAPFGSGDATSRIEDEPYVRNHRGPARPGGEETSELSRASPWHATLALGFARRDGATILERRSHAGPLRVQKPLFPDGAAVCHAIVLHPPGGIAGGDVLELEVRGTPGAHALLTTPGAGKWYRAGGRRASLRVTIDVSADAIVEWLPQPTIFFDGVDADLLTQIRLAPGGLYIGWETLCFGRTASGERFSRGRIASCTSIEREGRLLWRERAIVDGGSAWLGARAGLAGKPVGATLVAAGRAIRRDVVDACRDAAVPAGVDAGITALPDVLLARCLAADSERATMWLLAVWSALRPPIAGRVAAPPRIWNT